MNLKNILKTNRQSFLLLIYDLLLAGLVCFGVIFVYLVFNNDRAISFGEACIHTFIVFIILFGVRTLGKIYKQVWRYGGVQCYLRFIIMDTIAMVLFYICERFLPIRRLELNYITSIFAINLLITLTARIVYRYCYKYGNESTKFGKFLNELIKIASFGKVQSSSHNNIKKIPVAIVGAGSLGTSLAEDLLDNSQSVYVPRLFLENAQEKTGREIFDIDIVSENIELSVFEQYEIQEVIFAVPHMDLEKRQALYERYKGFGLKVKTYDTPTLGGEKKTFREFDPEELLFRKQVVIMDQATKDYYKNKTILITGGGGSIGSEMARQLAKMGPKKIVLLDIYENGVYDVRQELIIQTKNKLKVDIEICSITNKEALRKVFENHKPNIVIMAAAHKQVPLMEHNVVEAIYNNVFGTLNTVEIAKEFKVDRVILLSTDKAVNPTNVMGATKRVCEMIVKTYSSLKSHTTYSMTRFGNVLGSAGSVIPLFKKQIAAGGPITITDKRIIRYFMTIPEASQLVLKSGAMAKNGELFVLDMGKPVKIIELAESMIRLTGLKPYEDIDIQEVGLRPGEKLYEELLIQSEGLQKTKDKLIFIEKDEPLSKKELENNLSILSKAIASKDEEKARKALMKVVPTYKMPDEVNKKVK